MSGRASSTDRRRGESAFTLVEILVVLAVIGVLMAILLPVHHGAKERSREKLSQSRLAEVRTVLQKARDREQMMLGEVIGTDSFEACRQDPLPPVATLTGPCRAAWDAVNVRLQPYVGSLPVAQKLMTDGSGRPILVTIGERTCVPAGTDDAGDTLTAVHPSGDRSRPSSTVTLRTSGYGC